MVSYFSDGQISEKSYRLASLLKISECTLKDKRIYIILFTFMRNCVFPKCHSHYPLARKLPSGDCSQFRELVSVCPAPPRTWALLFLGSLSPELLSGREAVLKSWGVWGDFRYRLVQFFCLSHLFYREQVFIWWEIWGLKVYLRKLDVKVSEFNKEKRVGFAAELTTSFWNDVISYYWRSRKVSALFYFILTKALCKDLTPFYTSEMMEEIGRGWMTFLEATQLVREGAGMPQIRTEPFKVVILACRPRDSPL